MDIQLFRRRLLINPKFQLAFVLYTVAIAAGTIGVFYAADAYFFHKFTQLGQGMGLPSDHVFFQFIEEQQQTKSFYCAVAGLISCTVLGLIGLVASHRMAGPLYRLRSHCHSVALGETSSDVRFRQGDFFPEVAEAYNMQMKRYREALHAAGLDQPAQSSETPGQREEAKLKNAA